MNRARCRGAIAAADIYLYSTPPFSSHYFRLAASCSQAALRALLFATCQMPLNAFADSFTLRREAGIVAIGIFQPDFFSFIFFQD